MTQLYQAKLSSDAHLAADEGHVHSPREREREGELHNSK